MRMDGFVGEFHAFLLLPLCSFRLLQLIVPGNELVHLSQPFSVDFWCTNYEPLATSEHARTEKKRRRRQAYMMDDGITGPR